MSRWKISVNFMMLSLTEKWSKCTDGALMSTRTVVDLRHHLSSAQQHLPHLPHLLVKAWGLVWKAEGRLQGGEGGALGPWWKQRHILGQQGTLLTPCDLAQSTEGRASLSLSYPIGCESGPKLC